MTEEAKPADQAPMPEESLGDPKCKEAYLKLKEKHLCYCNMMFCPW